MGETTFYNRDKMWFGTTDYMQWIDTPNTGADVSPLGFSADATLLNGGGYVRNSWDSHKTYQFAWGQSASLALSHAINAYRNGSWGRGLIYFHDPMTYGTNILPKRWADPSMAANYEAEPLIPDVYPTTTPAAPGQMGLPVTSATYPLTTGYSSQANNSEHFIPIPPGMTLMLGAVYTGGGKLYVRVDGGAPVDIPTLDAATITAGSAVNLKVNGAKAYIGIRNTTGAATSISIQAITARLADSARLPDYMGQPTTNLLANPSFETASGTVDVITNLLTNPDMEAAGAAVVVRQNLWRDPLFTSTALYTPSGASSTLSVSGGKLTVTATGTNVGRCGFTHTLAASRAAGTYYLGVDIQSASANFTGFRIYLYDSASAQIRATLTSAAPTIETRMEFTATATGVFDTVFFDYTGTAIAAGNAGTFGRPYVSDLPGAFFSGATQPVVRTNRFNQPSFSNIVTGWSLNGAEQTITASPNGGVIDFTSAKPASSLVMFNATGAPAADGQDWASQIEVTVPAGYPAVSLRYDLRGYAGGSNQQNGTTSITIQPGQTSIVNVTTTNPTSALRDSMRVWLMSDTAGIPAGARIIVRRAQLEQSATNSTYFDGTSTRAGFSYAFTGAANSSPSIEWDADLSTRWQGTANASISELTGTSVPTVTLSGAGALPVIRSSRFSVQGSYSARSMGGAVPAAGAYFEFNPGMVASSTYTNIITSYSETVMPAATQSRQITVRCYGSSISPVINGPQAGTAPSATELRHSFTIPSDAATSTFRIQVTTAATGTVIPDTWWDLAAAIAGNYTGPAFSGSTTSSPDPDMTYVWTGAADASTSALRANGIANLSGTNPERAYRIQSGQWSTEGARSMRVIPRGVTASYGEMTFTGLTVGATYTIYGRIRLAAAITGTLHPLALGFWVTSSPTDPAVTYLSSAANSPGVYEVRGTFVAGSASGSVRFMNGSTNPSEDVYWDTVGLFSGAYAGPWGAGTFTTPINIEEALGPWYSGEGHSGVRFVGTPTVINYNGVNGGQIGLSCTLKEVGAWA